MNNMSVTTSGKKKSALATCTATKTGTFSIKIDHLPLDMIKDKLFNAKMREIINIVGRQVLYDMSFEIFTKQDISPSPTAKIYAARQAFSKSIIAFYSKFYDEYKKQEIKNRLLAFDKYCLVTDSRRREPKKAGGPGARARYQKSYR